VRSDMMWEDAGYNPPSQGVITRMHSQINAGNIPRMETSLAQRIEQRRKELDLSEAEVTRRGQLQKDTLRDLRRGKRQTVTSETLAKLAKALETTTELLAGSYTSNVTVKENRVAGRAQPDISIVAEIEDHLSRTPSNTRQVPLMGTAAGSIIHHDFQGTEMMSRPIDWLPCPPALLTVPDIYAVYVTGDSMSPMHAHGDIRFVNPHRPSNPGDTVIVETSNYEDDHGQAYIKILERRTGERLILRQLNPLATVEIPMLVVKSIHRVLTTGELFGR
jgi:phage repressor protein C with HTH and peptisase S24 domain